MCCAVGKQGISVATNNGKKELVREKGGGAWGRTGTRWKSNFHPTGPYKILIWRLKLTTEGVKVRKGVIISPLGKRFLRIMRVYIRDNVRRGRKGEAFTAAQRGEIVENDKQDESYSNRETRSWI